jgi:hypothetical protein
VTTGTASAANFLVAFKRFEQIIRAPVRVAHNCAFRGDTDMITRPILAALLALFLPTLLVAQAPADIDTLETRLLDSQLVDNAGVELKSHAVKRGNQAAPSMPRQS